MTAVPVLACVGALTWACSPAKSSPPPRAAAAATLSTPYGPMKPVVSVKELMQNMIDPAGDDVFDAVYWDVNEKGTIAHAPKTDDDWDKVRTGAVTIAEGIYLLKIPRPFTPPGDVNNSTGPNPPELSPTQIQAKLDKDPVLWQAKIEALRNVALEVMDVVNKKDTKALFDASEDMDKACEACHLEYWYPGDRAAVDEDARQHARFDKSAIRRSK